MPRIQPGRKATLYARICARGASAVPAVCCALRGLSCRPCRLLRPGVGCPAVCYFLRPCVVWQLLALCHSLGMLQSIVVSSIRWMLCHSLEGLPFAGCFAIRWMLCHSLEGLSFAGSFANHWKVCHLLAFLPFVGCFAIRWKVCQSLAFLPFAGIIYTK